MKMILKYNWKRDGKTGIGYCTGSSSRSLFGLGSSSDSFFSSISSFLINILVVNIKNLMMNENTLKNTNTLRKAPVSQLVTVQFQAPVLFWFQFMFPFCCSNYRKLFNGDPQRRRMARPPFLVQLLVQSSLRLRFHHLIVMTKNLYTPCAWSLAAIGYKILKRT